MKVAKAKALETIKLLGMDCSLLSKKLLEESAGVLLLKRNQEIVTEEKELFPSGDAWS